MLTITDRNFLYNVIIDWATRDAGIVEHIRHYAETRNVDAVTLWDAHDVGILNVDYLRDVYILTFREAGWGRMLDGTMRNMNDADLVKYAIALDALDGEVLVAFSRAVNIPVREPWGHGAMDVRPLQYYTDFPTYYIRNTPI